MSTNGYENCVAGTFYGFTNNENNNFYPGDTFELQWGAIDSGKTALNISLARKGGRLLDQIAVGAVFTTTSNLYRLVSNKTANCTLEQYTWAIPSDFSTTNPQYQIGLFDASAKLGTAGIKLYGWRSWSPYFYVRDKSSATVTQTTTDALLTGTGAPTPTTSPTASVTETNAPTEQSSESSNSKTIGIGVGVGVGGAALILLVLLAVFFMRRRRRKYTLAQREPSPVEAMSAEPSSIPAELSAHELSRGKRDRDTTGTQAGGVYEMPG